MAFAWFNFVLDDCESGSVGFPFLFFQSLYSPPYGETKNLAWGAGDLYRRESSLITFKGVQT